MHGFTFHVERTKSLFVIVEASVCRLLSQSLFLCLPLSHANTRTCAPAGWAVALTFNKSNAHGDCSKVTFHLLFSEVTVLLFQPPVFLFVLLSVYATWKRDSARLMLRNECRAKQQWVLLSVGAAGCWPSLKSEEGSGLVLSYRSAASPLCLFHLSVPHLIFLHNSSLLILLYQLHLLYCVLDFTKESRCFYSSQSPE